ncbi:MAG: ATP-binding protein [Deltaproteobacteria bacterium]|nr:ATP-binding protein [Deltaproteobacteria bacterium]
MKPPIGAAESEKLEFKARAVLDDPRKVVRELVGFLNAAGGNLWIGVSEQQGRATSVEKFDGIQAARSRLVDAIVGQIEPSLLVGREIIFHEEEVEDDGKGLLRIEVKEGGARPYAELRGEGRFFHIRTGARLRNMSRDELAMAFAKGPAAQRRFQKTQSEVQELLRTSSHEGKPGLTLVLRPSRDPQLQALKFELVSLLMDPGMTGNRTEGWNFIVPGEIGLRSLAGGVIYDQSQSFKVLQVQPNGTLRFQAQSPLLHWNYPPGVPSTLLWPYALLEYPASVFRLASYLFSRFPKATDLDEDDQILFGFAVTGLAGQTLRPGSPLGTRYFRPPKESPGSEYISPVLSVSWDDLRTKPDRCAYLCVRGLYEFFGFDEDDVPAEYNRETGILTFPR